MAWKRRSHRPRCHRSHRNGSLSCRKGLPGRRMLHQCLKTSAIGVRDSNMVSIFSSFELEPNKSFITYFEMSWCIHARILQARSKVRSRQNQFYSGGSRAPSSSRGQEMTRDQSILFEVSQRCHIIYRLITLLLLCPLLADSSSWFTCSSRINHSLTPHAGLQVVQSSSSGSMSLPGRPISLSTRPSKFTRHT